MKTGAKAAFFLPPPLGEGRGGGMHDSGGEKVKPNQATFRDSELTLKPPLSPHHSPARQ